MSKIWTYAEMSNKILGDLDLEDETFITSNELIGYFNEAIQEAEAEIHGTREDYFRTFVALPVVVGQDKYPLPADVYIHKIRRVVFSVGPLIYEVKHIKEWRFATEIAIITTFGQADWYRYYIKNDSPGNVQMVLFPKSRETAILPQLVPPGQDFQPIIVWYVRNAQRVPIVGEYIPLYENYLLPSAINVVANTITLTKTTYVTGDQVQFQAQPIPGGTAGLPAPLKAGVTYFVITTGTPGVIQLATTAANAANNVPLVLTSQGSANGYLTMSISATTLIIMALLIDIPEFATFIMQWVRCRCFEKEGDPRLSGAVSTLEQQRKQMVDTLTEMIVDSDTTYEMDYTHYQEMS